MQIMATIVSIYTHRTMVWIDRFEAMWGENVTVNFFLIFILKDIHFNEQNNQSFRTIELWEYFGISVV